MAVKIIVADDHTILRKAFVMLLRERTDFEICAETSNGSDTLTAIQRHQPHILFLDLNMPGMDGYQVLEKLQQQKTGVKTIVFSGFSSPQNIMRCIELNACGFLDKGAPLGEEIKAVDEVMLAGIYTNSQVTRVLQKQVKKQLKFKPDFGAQTVKFDTKELDIVYHYCCQKTSEEIGSAVNLSTRTVEGIKCRMMEKINAENFNGVVLYCYQQGFIDLDGIPLRTKPAA